MADRPIRRALEGAGQFNADHGLFGQVRQRVLRPIPGCGRSASNLGKSNKMVYQMDPANTDEALWEVGLDLAEVPTGDGQRACLKPRHRAAREGQVPCADVRLPGECGILHAKGSAPNGWLDERKVVLEALLAFKRLRRRVLTYFALTSRAG